MNIFKRYFLYLKSIWIKESNGFGDTVAKITSSFGIKQCNGCKRRQKKFNEALKYRKKILESKSNSSDSKTVI